MGHRLTRRGALGDGARMAATVPLIAAAPGALPTWVGWLIGLLIPLGGVLWFAAWQRGYPRRLEREGTLAYDAGAR